MSKEDEQERTNEETESGSKEGDQAKTNDDAVEPKYTQAEFDRAVTEASKKISENLEQKLALEKAEEESKRLEEAGKHEELYAKTKTELEKLREENARKEFELNGRRLLSEKGLGDHADVLMDGINDISGLIERADRFSDSVSKAVEAGISARLDTGKKKVPVNTTTTSTALADMTPEEWEAHKNRPR